MYHVSTFLKREYLCIVHAPIFVSYTHGMARTDPAALLPVASHARPWLRVAAVSPAAENIRVAALSPAAIRHPSSAGRNRGADSDG
jgi:hypothetical protein